MTVDARKVRTVKRKVAAGLPITDAELDAWMLSLGGIPVSAREAARGLKKGRVLAQYEWSKKSGQLRLSVRSRSSSASPAGEPIS